MRKVLFLLCLLIATSAYAQNPPSPVINPRTVEFTPSPDHDVIITGIGPKVTGYFVAAYFTTDDGTAPEQAILDIGKPTPVNNLITVTNDVWFRSLPQDRLMYVEVRAVGPGGSGVSADSNPFANVYAPAPVIPAPVVK
jgi:hypothetical protein